MNNFLEVEKNVFYIKYYMLYYYFKENIKYIVCILTSRELNL